VEISEASPTAILWKDNSRNSRSYYYAAGTGYPNLCKGNSPCLFEMFDCNITGLSHKSETDKNHYTDNYAIH